MAEETKSKITRMGIPVCLGCDERWANWPIVNLPLDTIKVRRRLRANCVARAFIKTPRGVEGWHLAQGPHGGLMLMHQIGANVT